MNPLTLVKRIQQINAKEAALGISEDASWHAKYKESAYVFVGGIPYDLTEGDLLAVFAQYGEIVDVNLVRDKATGKSKGFCFVAYEDQRSTNLAVDNLNGANVLGRVIRVDHVTKYKKKEEEDEEEEQQKREERGVCRAFQRGDCNRGASCKFSHNEQRAANTGWGAKEDSGARWEKDKYDGPSKGPKSTGNISSDRHVEPKGGFSRFRSDDKNGRPGRNEEKRNSFDKQIDINPRDQDRRDTDKRSERYEKETNHKDRDTQRTERSTRHDFEQNPEERDNRGRRETSGRRDSEPSYKRERESRKEERSGRHESERYQKQDWHHREDEKRTRYDRDSSHHHRREETDTSQRRSHR